MSNQISKTFNEKASELGCVARIGGNGKKIKFFEFRGTYSKGLEIWFGIDSQRFVLLTNKFHQLENL